VFIEESSKFPMGRIERRRLEPEENDSRILLIVQEHKASVILVSRHQDSILSASFFEDFPVTGRR
jgi:hypothetical protein